jgi:hypothetical protein
MIPSVSAAGVWGMDLFNEYLKVKKIILLTKYKPLEKNGSFALSNNEPVASCILGTQDVNGLQMSPNLMLITYKTLSGCQQNCVDQD